MSVIENLVNRCVTPDKAFSYFGDVGDKAIQAERGIRRARILGLATFGALGIMTLLSRGDPTSAVSAQGIEPGSCVNGWTYLGGDPEKVDQRGTPLAWIYGCEEEQLTPEPTPVPTDTPTPTPTDVPVSATSVTIGNCSYSTNSCNTTNVYNQGEQRSAYPTADYPRNPFQQQQQGTNVDVRTGPVVTGPNTSSSSSSSSSSVQLIIVGPRGFVQPTNEASPLPSPTKPFIQSPTSVTTLTPAVVTATSQPPTATKEEPTQAPAPSPSPFSSPTRPSIQGPGSVPTLGPK